MRIGGRTDKRTDMMKFIGAFRYLWEHATKQLWAHHVCPSVCQFHRRNHKIGLHKICILRVNTKYRVSHNLHDSFNAILWKYGKSYWLGTSYAVAGVTISLTAAHDISSLCCPEVVPKILHVFLYWPQHVPVRPVYSLDAATLLDAGTSGSK